MSQKFDLVAIEEKILEFFEKASLLVRSFLKSLFIAVQNYIRGKARFIPQVLPKGRREMIASILDQKKVQDHLQDFARECGLSLDHVEQSFKNYLHEIAADQNYLSYPFWDFLLTWVFQTIYEGIEVDEAALERLRPLAHHPIVFVPNHRSHMDYLILHYVLYCQAFQMPHICAGSNLSFWPLGPLFRKAGAFFIRRSYEGNKLYARAVQVYIEEILRQKMSLEFFIEGSRSRTGKMTPPRMGILSAIAQAYANGSAEDVIFVPTSFTYESVLEDKAYTEEQAGGHKRDENFWDLLRLRKYLKRRKGKVYVRFGDPLSAKKFIGSGETSDLRTDVHQFAYEITYGINKAAVVTPASLTASALLTDRSRGVSETRLQSKIEDYLNYLRYKGSRLSEALERYGPATIRDSLRTYVRSGLIEEFHDQDESLYRVVEEKRPLLDYYKNMSVHFFVSIGVLSCLLQHGTGLQTVEKICGDFGFLQELFREEFTFSRRQPLPTHVRRLLDYLIQAGVGRYEDPASFRFEKNHPLLERFAAPIRSFLEGYYVVWKTLSEIRPRPWEKKELIEFVLERARILYIKEEIQSLEAASKFTIQNALKAFETAGMVSRETEGWGKRRLVHYRVTKVDESLGLRLKELIT